MPTTPLTQGAGIAEDVAIPDDIFFTASQQFELEHADTVQANPSKPSRFGAPVTSLIVEQARESGVPPKTRQQTSWSCRVWGAWAKERNKLPRTETYESDRELLEDITKMNVKSLQFWLPKFVLEVRHADQQHYPPDSLYGICAGLQRGLKFQDRADVQIFVDAKYSRFRATLDAEMKRLHSLGMYQKKKAEVIGMEQEDMLWNMGLLGDSTPQVLLDTLVFYILQYGEESTVNYNINHLRLN